MQATLILVLMLAKPPQAPMPPQAPPMQGHKLPPASKQYAPETHTQAIATTGGFRIHLLRKVPILALRDRRWHQAGGLDGVRGWRATKYRFVPGKVQTRVDWINVKNSHGDIQQNRGLVREYPAGTRFDEVLENDAGQVFEHRTRVKDEDGWHSEISYENASARPVGYSGLKVSCASCHGQAGTGGYNEGLVPGGDTVLSDPMDWSVWDGEPITTEDSANAPARTIEEPQIQHQQMLPSRRSMPLMRGRRGGG